MKRLLPLLSIYLCLAGCLTHQTESPPISESELENVVFDVHIAESAMSALPNGTKKDSLANLYYDQIAEIHGIDRETLDTCLAILQRNPELTRDVYEKLSERFEEAKTEN